MALHVQAAHNIIITRLATRSLGPYGIHVGVWQPHHGGQYNHHAISLQPNCTMLGYHALHKLKSYSSLGVSMTPHRGTMQSHKHPYSSPTATQHPACGTVTSRVSRGEDLLCLERLHELADLDKQGDMQVKHAKASWTCKANKSYCQSTIIPQTAPRKGS